MGYNRLQLIVATLALTGMCSAIVIENEELLDIPDDQMAALIPTRKPGSLSARSPLPDTLCIECIPAAKEAIDRFNQYTYLNYYQAMVNVTNTDQLFGIKTCREFLEVKECFNQCIATLTTEQVTEVKGYLEYKTLKALQHLLCEGRYTPGHASCRLADTQRCNKIRRNNCGDSLVEYQECVDDILLRSGQNCSGYCSPARRYLRSQEFVWDMECALKATYKSQCKDIVTIFCFEPVKDTELNYGIYQDMDTIPEMANDLEYACRILESPFVCMDTATYGFYDYFGLNVTYACRGAEDTMDAVKANWQSIIDPFCGESTVNRTYEDVCPTPDPANAPPEVLVTVPLTSTTTTERTWEFYQPKEGRCPAAIGDPKACETVCGDDSHCAGTMKCCDLCCKEPLRRSVSRRPRLSTTPKTKAIGKVNEPRRASSEASSSRNIQYFTLTLVLLPLSLTYVQ